MYGIEEYEQFLCISKSKLFPSVFLEKDAFDFLMLVIRKAVTHDDLFNTKIPEGELWIFIPSITKFAKYTAHCSTGRVRRLLKLFEGNGWIRIERSGRELIIKVSPDVVCTFDGESLME